ncbi:hypothetical protein [Nocardioides humi]|uniref:Mce-associated membrane protein n=1 Tax=Nocardioides humi TaxID=449461 RepID=A0ABN2BKL0_9ACTN|nr:hypothetical protein [Nocardioides humi]
MSRPTPRKPASSRGQTPRPRRIAGQAGTGRPPSAEEGLEETPQETPGEASGEPTEETVDAPAESELGPSSERVPGILARPRTTRVLIAVLALVTIALVAEFAILVVDHVRDDDEPPARATDGSGALVVPKGRPVVAAQLQVRDGVEAAAKAAQEIVSVDYAKYDEEVDKAADLMTDRFEEQFRTTIGDVKEQAVAQKTVVQASVVAQGVVRANRTRLEALVFLNQVVQRERDGKPETVVTPYKMLMTMVHTDHGWLVDGIETDDPSAAPQQDTSGAPEQDKTN